MKLLSGLYLPLKKELLELLVSRRNSRWSGMAKEMQAVSDGRREQKLQTLLRTTKTA
jgi:hypothetical protein